MANDIDLYSAGDLAPYSPSQPLAPDPDWGSTEVDLLREPTESYTGGGQMIFGQALPPGVSVEQITQAYQQLGNVFVNDFMQLGHNLGQTQKAVAWFMAAMRNPPRQQPQRHSYNLFEHVNDPLFQAFANYAHDQGFSAKLIQDAAWWVAEAGRKLQQANVGTPPVQGRTPSSNPLDDLTDAQYAQVVRNNDNARAATMGYLQDLWGSSFNANLRMVDAYYQSLPLREQRALDVLTDGYISALNTVEVVLGLYQQAVGSSSLPTGGALATELSEHERIMKFDRKRWNKDERLQARYRELLRIRDGG
ncbi:hypothetical protein D3C77_299980 [compost metagenome]